jgi:hypothetical protein
MPYSHDADMLVFVRLFLLYCTPLYKILVCIVHLIMLYENFQQSHECMRHAKRRKLTVDDMNLAMKNSDIQVLNFLVSY